MKNLTKYFILIWAVTMIPNLYAEENKVRVELPIQNQTFVYKQNIRLDQLISTVWTNSPSNAPLILPLGFQLFDKNKNAEALELKQKVIERLQYVQKSDDTLAQSAQLLQQQIQHWDVGYRLNISLDYDLVRLFTKNNPVMDGDFELITPIRKESVFIEGLLFKPHSAPLSSTKPLHDYLSDAYLLSSAHQSYVWVIYPDGKYKRVGYAAWNEESINLTPNTSIFIGMDSDTPAWSELEEDIVKLITMRKAQ
ncbi:hypothetical protein DZ860_19285 [Vibrio sinensis]|uniref:Uncharacterized protein n=2 Tax=Vibrio sinensis TaxID=2302434 RepID=A0A3A6Q7L0_9VIBR|nr:hypothetical protein DZ860_19285 [Vibrio sinensis]